MSDVPETLAAALARVQAELPRVTKDETAEVQTKQGGRYSYSYADLADVSAAVMPLLGRHGLSFIARPTLAEGRLVLAYSLLHTSGEREDGVYPLRADGTPQAVGGEITYARRYCLCAVTGVAPENDDDDAQAAQATARRPQRSSSTPDNDAWYTRTEAEVDPLKAAKLEVWQAAQDVGLGRDDLARDYAAEMDGQILANAGQEDLATYLGRLRDRLTVDSDQSDDATQEVADE